MAKKTQEPRRVRTHKNLSDNTTKLKVLVVDREVRPLLRAHAGRIENDYRYTTVLKLENGELITSYSKVLYSSTEVGGKYSVSAHFYKMPNGQFLLHI